MGKAKKGKGKVKDPRVVAQEKNEAMISAAMRDKPEQIVGNLAAREANPGLGTIAGVLEYKAAEQEGHEFIEVDYENAHGRTSLMYAAIKGFVKVADCLLENKADPNRSSSITKDGLTALHLAAFYGQESILERLVLAKADVNAQDADGEASLHKAAFQGQDAGVALLVDLHADLTVANHDERTAIQVLDHSPAKEKDDIKQFLKVVEATTKSKHRLKV